MGFLWVLCSPPKNLLGGGIGCSKLRLGVNGNPQRTGIPSRVYSCPMPRVPITGPGSTKNPEQDEASVRNQTVLTVFLMKFFPHRLRIFSACFMREIRSGGFSYSSFVCLFGNYEIRNKNARRFMGVNVTFYICPRSKFPSYTVMNISKTTNSSVVQVRLVACNLCSRGNSVQELNEGSSILDTQSYDPCSCVTRWLSR